MATYLDGMNGGKHNSDVTIVSFTPKNKINAGDKVTTKTDAVYQPTQQSLNNLTGTVFFINGECCHVKLNQLKGKPVVEFSINELTKI